MAETVHTSMNDPENTAAIEYMRARLARLQSPPTVQPADPDYSDYLTEID